MSISNWFCGRFKKCSSRLACHVPRGQEALTLITLLLSFSFLLPAHTRAADLKLLQTTLTADGKLQIEHTSDPAAYYVLYRGDTVVDISFVVDMAFGVQGVGHLTDSQTNGAAGFYRVLQVSLNTPLDTDGDGIDDVYELNHFGTLNALDPSDAFADPDGDGLTNVEEYKRGTDPLISEYIAPTVNPVESPTRSVSVILTGTAKPASQIKVEVNQGATQTGSAGANGTYALTVPLPPNRLNRLFISAVDTNSQSSSLQPLEVIQDSLPPSLFIDFPTNNSVLVTTNTMIAGRVGDLLSGFLGLSVTVSNLTTLEGGTAIVNVGIGNNGTYERGNLPLALGTNQIQVIATDKVGNSATQRITLIRAELTGQRILSISGDQQKASAHRRLTTPLTVRATEADGTTAIANKTLAFQVIRSDGRLLPVDAARLASPYTNHVDANGNGSLNLELTTDAQGQAQVWWTMGGDAGCANNRLQVTMAGVSNTLYFCASATPAPLRQINVGSGNNQKTETSATAPEVIRAWVSDSCNGIEGVPITFRVVSGGAKLIPVETGVSGGEKATRVRGAFPSDGVTEMTVPSARTGHSAVRVILGPDAGQNVIEANYAGNPGLPATFTLYGVKRDLTVQTSLTGLVLDNTSQPIGHALCELFIPPGSAAPLLTTYSDTQGRFRFDLSTNNSELTTSLSGAGDLFIYGPSATTLGTNPIPPNTFPFLSYAISLIPNVENSLPRPVLLPRLNPSNGHTYYGTNDLILTCEGIEGLKMTIKAGSMRDARGLLVTPQNPAQVSLNQVHHDSVPMPIPDGASPPFSWTLQPGRSTFDPPIQIEYPNMSGLPAGTIAYFLSFNHDTEKFEIVASGHVDAQGATIHTDPGAGLTISGWGCNCPPYSVTGECGGCAPSFGGPDSSCPDCDSTVPNSVQSVTDKLLPGKAPSSPTNLGYSDPFAINPDIAVYCDLDAGLWRVKVTAVTLCITQYIGLGPFTDVTAALVQATTDCSELSNMYNDLNNQANQHIDVTQIGTRKVYYMSAAVAHHEQTHVKWFNEDVVKDGLPPLKATVESLTEPFQAFPDADQAKAAILSLPQYMAATNALWAVVFKSVARQQLLEPLKDVNHEAVDPMIATIFSRLTSLCPTPLTPALPELPLARHRVWTTALPEFPGFSDAKLRARQATAGTWVLSVNGQSINADTGRGFTVQNISATDQFGDAPGSAPDFIGDDLVRVVAVSSSAAGNRYAQSAFFRIAQGQRVQAPPLSLTTVPPRTPESLHVVLGSSLLNVLGMTTQLRAVATYSDGSTEELNSAEVGTTFRVSNPSVVTVDSQGTITAIRNGHAIVTASNQGATSTAEIDVAPGSSITSVHGFVRNSDGTAASGVKVSLTGLATPLVVTGPNGEFVIEGAPTAFGAISVIARTQGSNGGFFAAIGDLSPVANGITDAGTLTLAPIPAVPRFLAGGNQHSLATQRDGSLWAWGENGRGQLGDGTRSTRLSPVRVGSGTGWVTLAAGSRHSLGLQSDGSLWAWGDGSFGQLGLGLAQDENAPKRLDGAADWTLITGGDDFSLGLRADGTLWAWGGNLFGQLGDESTTNQLSPKAILPSMTWRSAAGGRGFTLAVRSDGTLWSWGHNNKAQLGDGTLQSRIEPRQVGTENNWESVAAGSESSLAIKLDGSLWAWGLNTGGQLGMGDETPRLIPTRVGADFDWWYVTCSGSHTVALKLDGSLWSWGGNSEGEVVDSAPSEILSPIRVPGSWLGAIAPTLGGFTLAVDRTGALFSWGYNDAGQLGIGLIGHNRLVPTRIGEDHFQNAAAGNHRSAAFTISGTMETWGIYPIGDGTLSTAVFPVSISSPPNPISFAVGSHFLLVTSDGVLWGWGDDFQGQVGLGTSRDFITTPTRIGTRNDWQQVEASASHSLAVAGDGTLWAWGLNSSGELGDGSTTSAFAPVPVTGIAPGIIQMAAGEGFSIVLRSDGTLWSWGANTAGELGDGSAASHSKPAQIGQDTDWRSVSAGSHVLAVKTNGSFWVWGLNRDNQLGDGTRIARLVPTLNTLITNFQTVSAGYQHSAVIKTDGTLWMWGRNVDGQLGDGTTANRSKPIQIGSDNDWVAVSAGVSHTIARKTDGSLWAWGSNDLGELGTSRRYSVGSESNWGSTNMSAFRANLSQ